MTHGLNELVTNFENSLEALCQLDKDRSIPKLRKVVMRDALLGKLEAEWKPLLGFSKRDIANYAIIKNTPEAKEEDSKKTFSLSEILAIQNQNSEWIVPELIRAKGALYILGAKPKVGKSLWLYDLAASVAVKGKFLDRPCTKCKVLYFPLEESDSLVARRLKSAGLEPDLPEVKEAMEEERIQIEKEFSLASDLSHLDEMLKEYKPDLVIFDSFRAMTHDMNVSENSSDISKGLYALQRLFISRKTTGIVVHHMNKSSEPGQGASGLSGSLSIAGATDGAILLYHYEMEKEKSRDVAEAIGNPQGRHILQLETQPREGTLLNWVIERRPSEEGHSSSFTLLSEKGVDPIVAENRPRILRMLAKAALANPVNCRFSKAEICDKLGIPPDASSSAISRTLGQLLDAQIISGAKDPETRRYYYWMDINNPWIRFVDMSSHENAERTVLSKEALDADELINCSTREQISSLLDEWGKPYTTKIYKILTAEEKEKINNILFPRQFEVGQWVELDDAEGVYKVNKYHFQRVSNSNEGEEQQEDAKASDVWYYELIGLPGRYPESSLSPSLDYAPIVKEREEKEDISSDDFEF